MSKYYLSYIYLKCQLLVTNTSRIIEILYVSNEVQEPIEESLIPVNESKLFEQIIDDSYGEEVQVGFIKLSTSQVMKDQDPVSWEIAQGEYIDGLVQDEELISFDNENTYFWKHDVENYIEEVELEMEEAAQTAFSIIYFFKA